MDSGEDYFVCPHCGAEVKRDARACPECGSDAGTGWSEDADKWAADIPTGYGHEDEFDYADFVRREFGTAQEARGASRRWVRVLLFAAILVCLLGLLLQMLAR